jgi:hypothetical protein
VLVAGVTAISQPERAGPTTSNPRKFLYSRGLSDEIAYRIGDRMVCRRVAVAESVTAGR